MGFLEVVHLQTLEQLGWNSLLQDAVDALGVPGLVPARVTIEYKDRYRVRSTTGSQMVWPQQGHLEQLPEERAHVGDWVALSDDRVHAILPRKTSLRRIAAGGRGIQVVAANLDRVFLVTSMNRDFNVRRLERYLVAICAGGIAPVVVLNKSDLQPRKHKRYLQKVRSIAEDFPVVITSASLGDGLAELSDYLGAGQTVGFVGSSGVGKSSLINCLLKEDVQDVRPIRAHDERGLHTTTHRELFLLPDNQGVLVDTPGMRELRLSDSAGLAMVFGDIEDLAEKCRWRDCRHGSDEGCAIQAALADGTLSQARWWSYQKLIAEIEEMTPKHLR